MQSSRGAAPWCTVPDVRRPGPEFGLRRSRVHGVPLALLAAALCASPSLAAAQTEPTADPTPPASEGAPPPAPPAPPSETDKQAAPSPAPANDGQTPRRPDAGDVKPAEPKAEAPKAEAPKTEPPPPETGFFLGTYGRAVSATDFRKRPGRDADIVARGSRLDESPYVEIDVQRQDYWKATGATTRAVITLGTSAPLFHYNADFNVRMAVRNLFLQANNIVTKGLSAWVGSRMYRGDDSYLLDFWPLDNLNTMGGGLRYDLREWPHLRRLARRPEPAEHGFLPPNRATHAGPEPGRLDERQRPRPAEVHHEPQGEPYREGRGDGRRQDGALRRGPRHPLGPARDRGEGHLPDHAAGPRVRRRRAARRVHGARRLAREPVPPVCRRRRGVRRVRHAVPARAGPHLGGRARAAGSRSAATGRRARSGS